MEKSNNKLKELGKYHRPNDEKAIVITQKRYEIKENYYEAVPVYKKGSMNQEDIFGQLANSLLPRAVIAFSPTLFCLPQPQCKAR